MTAKTIWGRQLEKSTETEIILQQGAGYTIARSLVADTSVPYGPITRPDGNLNHGWVDLRDRPDLVVTIPEAKKSAGLAKLLTAIAEPVSKVMSSACECGAFDRGEEQGGNRWQVGGFVVTMFREADRNADPENLAEMARYILGGISPTEEHHIGFEMIVEPLRTFFGRSGCYALALKPMGFGATESQAWSAFEYAITACATAIARDRPINAG